MAKRGGPGPDRLNDPDDPDEHDPFSYEPLRRQKKRRLLKSLWAGRKNRPAPSQPLPQRSPIKEAFLTQAGRAHGGTLPPRPAPVTHCCFCQMPLDLLSGRGQSPHRHQEFCMEMRFSALPPCSAGADCNSLIRSHYAQVNHFELARWRDGSPAQADRTNLNPEDPEHPEDPEDPEDLTWASSLVPQVVLTGHDSDETELESGKELREAVVSAEEDRDMFEELVDDHLSEPHSSGAVPPGQWPESNSSTSPFMIRAEKDDDNVEVEIQVAEHAQLRSITLQIPSPEKHLEQSLKILSASVVEHPLNDNRVSVAEAKKRFQSIFNRAQKAEPVVPAAMTSLSDEVSPMPGSSGLGLRKCPFYRKIPSTSFVVDAFSYGIIPGVTKYFLSHFHYDHYNGLRKSFNQTIVCSVITARMIQLKIKVHDQFIRALPMNEPIIIENVEVTLLDANHCPGAVMFLYKFVNGTAILHCGDFRATPHMEECPALWNNSIDKVFLDTTYCKPEYDFPSQSDVIQATIDLVEAHLATRPKTLILVGTYTIGKERIFTALADKLDCSIWASTEKTRILKTLDDPIIENRLKSNPRMAKIHVMEMKRVRDRGSLKQYLEVYRGCFQHILTVIPTGWTHARGSTSECSLKSLRIKTCGTVSSLEVPYSEHSSYSELERFIKFLKLPSSDRIIPTVNVGNPAERASMKKIFQGWLANKSPSPHINEYFKTNSRA
ncbi:hypothetical protein TCAL_10022 [Tigriopus californicus]|uniref:DNA cross-link repair 1A protein n=1 Tax=Tigriopus californicus TaxID=6832 RepID=A0A553NY34_TIGCA|nr:DNA cross-link repair 1A protein-like [Tigriopus californicus]TRY70339.1 hypothetical protein TCAL_10022 [Tigriopus californicus]|eukprot:TCALIF_10022-PA protein Name:"Similar to Dclre1a DNA cross-link repair 1A protein (Mus musculus)" AED:0.07 eAED:0.47 QI:0/-1/0/1/-1/1/1/0/718